MKVKVIQSFIDKTTNQVRVLNETFECNEERYEEIKKAGNYVEPVATKKKGNQKEHGNATTNI